MVGRWELGLSAEQVTAHANDPSSGRGGGGLPRGCSCSWGAGAALVGLCTVATKSWMLPPVPCTMAAEG